MNLLDKKVKIRRMKEFEVPIAIKWAKLEGWIPGLNDAKLFYNADPNGFFCGTIDGHIIAVGSAVKYDSSFAFCGLYIVHPEFRGKGYGMALTKARLFYAQGCNVGIDGVLENVHLYKRIGYKTYYENARYQFEAVDAGLTYENIYPINQVSFERLKIYDRQCFPASRDNFLQAWINDDNAISFACIQDDEIKGYVVRRKCHEGYRIGPLFADNVAIAEHLLLSCQQNIIGESIFIDIPDINNKAKSLISNFKMKQVFACARMYIKELPDLEYNKIFGTSSLELG